ncbi:MAG: LysR family transcriptional regulator [Rhodobacteraceae bacterium]|nr:LysR family transcriptional regulator [Paracoccaceae bacterium]
MRYFERVATLGSIRAASRDLNVASSAVNRQVLWLEETLGLSLFERVGRRLVLAPAGEILLAHVRRTYSDFDSTIGELDALQGLRRGSVTIATVESISEKLLPTLISRFRQTYPGIHVSVVVSSSDEAAGLVERGEADVGFTFNPPERAALTISYSVTLPIGALMVPDHGLNRPGPLKLVDCMRYPIVLPTKGMSLRSHLDAALAQVSTPLRTYVESNSLRFMRALVKGGNVISFQTKVGCEEEIESGELVFRPLSDRPLQDDRLCVVTSARRSLALSAGMFYDHSVSYFRAQLLADDANSAS